MSGYFRPPETTRCVRQNHSVEQLVRTMLHNQLLLLLLSLLLWIDDSECQTCKYSQYIEPGRAYSVNNPRHPNAYGPYAACSWEAYTRDGANVEVECSRVDLPKSTSGRCLDYLTTTINGASTSYCAPFKVAANRVLVNLRGSTARGGYFNCVFRAVEVSPPATRPAALPASCDCGWNRRAPRNRVVGGVVANVHEFPSMASLVNVQARSLGCGGTIISYRAVLTAAHCTYRQNPSNYGLLVGEHDITTGSDTTETQLKKVARFITHPGYNEDTAANDVALAIPDTPFSFTENIGPACLPFLYQTPTNSYLTIAGWGTTEFGGSQSNVLRKADVRIVSHANCARTYSNYNPISSVCTYERGKDACQYDSGGPLYDYNSQKKQFIMAIVSNGRDCGAEWPAVNTRVASYLDWIQSQLPNEEFCRKPQ